ncbi:MAG: hypothetical protein PWP31_491 [Clostridia bacterium]|nr:hypothetical protein [Clostridia bacterium]
MTNVSWPFNTPGIPDSYFRRGQVPLTKEEIRVITLSKARLGPEMTVYDIGSGTGSISIEAAKFVSPGQVFAIESNPEAQALIEQNARLFNLSNLKLVLGQAPAVLENLPQPDRVIIGGSGGYLSDILKISHDILAPGGIIVVNAITVETLNTSLCFGRENDYEVDAVSANLSRLVQAGRYHIWKALNPVYIIQLVKSK